MWRPSSGVEALRERAAMLGAVRDFFAARDVLEVQTPVLGRHGVTDPAIDSMRLTTGRYLQTSPEYHMKRLLAAGAPSIYQVGPVFRDGEEGRWHNPEFTMIEWYRLGFDAPRLMAEVAELVDVLIGPGSYENIAYADLLERRSGVDVSRSSDETLLHLARGLGSVDDIDVDGALDLIFADAVGTLHGRRVFVTDFPAHLASLARVNEEGSAARFELVVDGVEVANGYHELGDADELERRMASDAARRRQRGSPAVAPDERLIAAQRHGLPDCAGVAVGFDRLLAIRLGVSSIAGTMAFDWGRA